MQLRLICYLQTRPIQVTIRALSRCYNAVGARKKMCTFSKITFGKFFNLKKKVHIFFACAHSGLTGVKESYFKKFFSYKFSYNNNLLLLSFFGD